MKKRMKICALVVGAMILTSSMTYAQSLDNIVTLEEGTEVEPRTHITGWRYAVIDGHLYKRLYNYSTERWETDWILVQ